VNGDELDPADVDELADIIAATRQPDPNTLAQAILSAGYMRVIEADGSHRYLSTGCLHDTDEGHDFCRVEARRYDGTPKTASRCKFCPAACRCRCHTAVVQDGESRG
jgi:hypothetical protein